MTWYEGGPCCTQAHLSEMMAYKMVRLHNASNWKSCGYMTAHLVDDVAKCSTHDRKKKEFPDHSALLDVLACMIQSREDLSPAQGHCQVSV